MAEYTKNELFRFDMMNAVEHESPVSNDDITEFVLECIRRREIEIADELAALFGTMSAFDDTKQYTFEQNFRKYIDRLRNPADDVSKG